MNKLEISRFTTNKYTNRQIDNQTYKLKISRHWTNVFLTSFPPFFLLRSFSPCQVFSRPERRRDEPCHHILANFVPFPPFPLPAWNVAARTLTILDPICLLSPFSFPSSPCHISLCPERWLPEPSPSILSPFFLSPFPLHYILECWIRFWLMVFRSLTCKHTTWFICICICIYIYIYIHMSIYIYILYHT